MLGGGNAKLFRIYDNHYVLKSTKDGDEISADSNQEAMEAYNYLNHTNWALDYIEKTFEPFYEKHFLIYTEETFPVESLSHPGDYHDVKRLRDGSLVCDAKCMGFRIRHHCSHVDLVRDFLKEQENNKGDKT